MGKPFKSIIMRDLKSEGKHHLITHIKSIRYSSFAGGDAVDVRAVGLTKPDRDDLDGFLRRYTYGRFDGMTDYYEYDNRRPDIERQVKYVTLQCDYLPEQYDRARAILAEHYGVTDDKTAQAKLCCWFNQAVYRLLNGWHPGFMDSSTKAGA